MALRAKAGPIKNYLMIWRTRSAGSVMYHFDCRRTIGKSVNWLRVN